MAKLGSSGDLFVPADLPSINDRTVVFRNGNILAPDSIWSFTGGVFTKVAELARPSPAARPRGSPIATLRFLAGVPGTKGTLRISDPGAITNAPVRFYRVQTPP